jgi:hypothetical protein
MSNAASNHKYNTVGYIVGYDGQVIGGAVPRGKWVLPVGGINAVADFFESREDAVAALGDRTEYQQLSLSGVKRYVLKVHEVKLKWFPFAEGHIGYRKLANSKADSVVPA